LNVTSREQTDASECEVRQLASWLAHRMDDVDPRPRAPSEILRQVIFAYGDRKLDEIRTLVDAYLRAHKQELRRLLAAQAHDCRRPPLLLDLALPCILERLEHDKYALRREWTPEHDPRDLRRLADLWGVRIGFEA
jgi:hypothetical protein